MGEGPAGFAKAQVSMSPGGTESVHADVSSQGRGHGRRWKWRGKQ